MNLSSKTPRVSSTLGTLAAAAACAALLFAAPAMGQPRPGGERFGGERGGIGASAEGGARFAHRGERRGERLAMALDLTNEQITAWEDLRAAHDDATTPLREELRSHHEALRSLLEDGSADATAVGTEMLAGRDLREDLKAAAEELDASFRDLLTAEQLERYETIQEMGGPRHRGRARGPRRGRGQRGSGPAGALGGDLS